MDLSGRGRKIPFTAFTSKKIADQVGGRLVLRRIPDLGLKTDNAQTTLFDTWRFHAFFPATDPNEMATPEADKTHRHHAIIEQAHADLEALALAHGWPSPWPWEDAWMMLYVSFCGPPAHELAT
jgi:hypothetical protein